MTDSASEIAYLVTIKLPRNPDHNPRAKLTDSCAVSDNCTDSTGEHHTYLARTIEEVQAETRHITRIETIELATAGAPSEEPRDLLELAKHLHRRYGRNQPKSWDDLPGHLQNGWLIEAENIPHTAAGVGSPVPVQVDETKLAEAVGWEPPGWDDRKQLASLFQDHCTIPESMTLDSIYPALIAIAGHGYELAKEHVSAAMCEQLQCGAQ